MRTVFRIVCLIIGVLAFVYALDELANLIFDTGEGDLGQLIVLSMLCLAAFAAVIFEHNWETYPARMKEERFEEELEAEAERQLRAR